MHGESHVVLICCIFSEIINKCVTARWEKKSQSLPPVRAAPDQDHRAREIQVQRARGAAPRRSVLSKHHFWSFEEVFEHKNIKLSLFSRKQHFSDDRFATKAPKFAEFDTFCDSRFATEDHS